MRKLGKVLFWCMAITLVVFIGSIIFVFDTDSAQLKTEEVVPTDNKTKFLLDYTALTGSSSLVLKLKLTDAQVSSLLNSASSKNVQGATPAPSDEDWSMAAYAVAKAWSNGIDYNNLYTTTTKPYTFTLGNHVNTMNTARCCCCMVETVLELMGYDIGQSKGHNYNTSMFRTAKEFDTIWSNTVNGVNTVQYFGQLQAGDILIWYGGQSHHTSIVVHNNGTSVFVADAGSNNKISETVQYMGRTRVISAAQRIESRCLDSVNNQEVPYEGISRMYQESSDSGLTMIRRPKS